MAFLRSSLSCIALATSVAAECVFTSPGSASPIGTQFSRLSTVYTGDSMNVAWNSNFSLVSISLVQQFSDSSDAATHQDFLIDGTATQISWTIGAKTSFNYTESMDGPVYYWLAQDSNKTGTCTSELFRVRDNTNKQAVATTSGVDAGSSTATLSSSAATSAASLPANSGLTDSEKLGIGLGLGIGLPIIATAIGLFLFWFSRRRTKDAQPGSKSLRSQRSSPTTEIFTPSRPDTRERNPLQPAYRGQSPSTNRSQVSPSTPAPTEIGNSGIQSVYELQNAISPRGPIEMDNAIPAASEMASVSSNHPHSTDRYHKTLPEISDQAPAGHAPGRTEGRMHGHQHSERQAQAKRYV